MYINNCKKIITFWTLFKREHRVSLEWVILRHKIYRQNTDLHVAAGLVVKKPMKCKKITNIWNNKIRLYVNILIIRPPPAAYGNWDTVSKYVYYVLYQPETQDGLKSTWNLKMK